MMLFTPFLHENPQIGFRGSCAWIENNAKSFTVAVIDQTVPVDNCSFGGGNVHLSGVEMCAGVTKWQRVAGFTWQKQ